MRGRNCNYHQYAYIAHQRVGVYMTKRVVLLLYVAENEGMRALD